MPSPRVAITVNGMAGIDTDLQGMQVAPQNIATYLNLLANSFLTSLVKFAPVKTGTYIRSWRILEQSNHKVVVGPAPNVKTSSTAGNLTTRQLAVILEYSGANAHEIRPKNKFALKFEWNGTTTYFTVVKHPGMKPRPHIRPALMETKRKARGFAKAWLAGTTKNRKWRQSLATSARQDGYDGGIPPRQTGRNRRDTSANITRGTKGDLRAKLSVGLSGKRLRARGLTRAVGSNESGLKAVRKSGQRIQGQGLEKFRQ